MIRAVARDDVWELHEAHATGLFKLAAVIKLAHGHHRRTGRLRRVRLDAVADHPSAEAEAALTARRVQIVAAVRALPARQRDSVVLHYFTGLTDTQIAEVLGISPGSVKTHLHRARATLATQLEELR